MTHWFGIPSSVCSAMERIQKSRRDCRTPPPHTLAMYRLLLEPTWQGETVTRPIGSWPIGHLSYLNLPPLLPFPSFSTSPRYSIRLAVSNIWKTRLHKETALMRHSSWLTVSTKPSWVTDAGTLPINYFQRMTDGINVGNLPLRTSKNSPWTTGGMLLRLQSCH